MTLLPDADLGIQVDRRGYEEHRKDWSDLDSKDLEDLVNHSSDEVQKIVGIHELEEEGDDAVVDVIDLNQLELVVVDRLHLHLNYQELRKRI